MSDEEQVNDTLTAEFRDGQLQIVEVTYGDKDDEDQDEQEDHILPDVLNEPSTSGQQTTMKYVQVMDPNGKGVINLDLLNFTLVRCDDTAEYRLMANADAADGESNGDDESTVTCVLQDDGDENQDSSYVMVEGGDGPLMFLQSNVKEQKKETTKEKQVEEETKESRPQFKPEKPQSKPELTPAEILKRAQDIQKAKALLVAIPSTKRGRKRKGDLPPPEDMLSSPSFKLYLYSCKMCSFKCNAIKDLTAHKAEEHTTGSGRWRTGSSGRPPSNVLQCARCPYKAASQTQLLKHLQDKHSVEVISKPSAGSVSSGASTTDVLVCGACGFESSSRPEFKEHITTKHINSKAKS